MVSNIKRFHNIKSDNLISMNKNTHLGWKEPEEHVAAINFIDGEETRVGRELSHSLHLTQGTCCREGGTHGVTA